MRRTTLSIIPVALAMSACFSLGRDTPILRQYVLAGATASAGESAGAPAGESVGATVGTTDVVRADPSGVTLGVRRLDLATYLASESIVVRQGAHGMLSDEYNRWGEDPVAGINRAFASHLAAAAPVRAVDVAPWPVRSRHDFLVQLHVSRFEGVMPEDTLATHGDAHLLATWELTRPQDGRVVARGSTDHRAGGWRAGDHAALVALLDGGLKRMADDIVTCIGRIGPSDAPADASAAEGEPPIVCD